MWAEPVKKSKSPPAYLKTRPQRIMTKLKVGKPGDMYEQEADRVADTVMRMPEQQVRRQPREEEEEAMQMQSMEEEEELQMQSMEDEEQQLQMQQREDDDEQQAQSEEDTASVNTTYCNRPLPQHEVDERNEILEDFTRGLPDLNESVRTVLISSICDFSLTQLNMMKEAGLRFWMGGGVPPVFEEAVARNSSGGSASYARAIRTIFLGTRVNPGYVTHEMAHAWDHIRNLPSRRRVRLDDISDSETRRNLMTSPGEYLTESDQPQDIQIGGRSLQKSFSEMHAAYNSRVPLRELAFSGTSRLGYSQTDPQEFYAEGYTVFHGNSINQQAKLYKYARELYEYLLAEAREQQMPVPDINEVRTEASQLPDPQ